MHCHKAVQAYEPRAHGCSLSSSLRCEHLTRVCLLLWHQDQVCLGLQMLAALKSGACRVLGLGQQ